MPPPQAVVFDLDGLLVDTEPLWVDVECRLFNDELGVALTPGDCAQATGLRIDEWVRYWHEKRPWPRPSLAEVEAMLIDRMAIAIATTAEPMPGAHQAIDVARRLGSPSGSHHRLQTG